MSDATNKGNNSITLNLRNKYDSEIADKELMRFLPKM